MPDRSKAQARMMFHLEEVGKVAPGTGKEFLRATPGGYKGLPERVGKKKRKRVIP